MAIKLDSTIVQGIENEFYGGMAEPIQRWKKYCQELPAITKKMKYAFPGRIPKPRLLVDGRALQGLNQFEYSLENHTFELSMLFDLQMIEDDQTGLVFQVSRDVGRSFASYKNDLFCAMLSAGGTGTAFDDLPFFSDTRTVGGSGTIDNNLTSNITDTAFNTSAEFRAAMIEARAVMGGYKDDVGRPRNDGIMESMMVLAPLGHEAGIREALSASIISNTSNVFTSFAEAEFTAHLPDPDRVYFFLNGNSEKGMVYSQRIPLSVMFHTDEKDIEHNLGILLECRERFAFGYGRPELCARHIYT